MIYCIPIENYPTEKRQIIEECTYKDENDFEWRIARIKNGFIVRYFGDPYFQYDRLNCELSNGENVQIKNTNCIFFKDADFETFYHVRAILQEGCTDDIWSAFEDFFSERFEHDLKILESEII